MQPLNLSPFTALAEEHYAIEARLDEFAAALARGEADGTRFHEVHEMVTGHYGREEAFLDWLAGRDAGLAAKLREQHREALEIAEWLQHAHAEHHAADVMHLSRRYLATVQHSISEEERDAYPLVAGWRVEEAGPRS